MFPIPILLAMVALFFFFLLRITSPARPTLRPLNEGQRLFHEEKFESALVVFDMLARQRELDASGRELAYLWLGRTLERLERPDAARKVYLRYLTDYTPERGADPEVLLDVRGRLNDLLEDMADSSDEHAAAAPVEEITLPLTLRGARRLLDDGEYERARDVLTRLIVGRPTEASGRESALHMLGSCYEQEGKPEKARQIYMRYMKEYAAAPDTHRPTTRLHAQVAERLKALGAPPSTWSWVKDELGRPLQALEGMLTKTEPETATETAPGPPPVALPPQTPDERARDQHFLDRGLRVGDYVIAEKLGEGGFGEVYRALRPVAIKFARDPEAVEHLRRFGVLQGQIESDRIVKPLEVNLQADPPYVVMEFIDGPTLRDLMRAKGALPAHEALALLTEVARALDDAHRAGVLHLDLKPANVLLDEQGGVKLTDFELGRVQGESSQLRLSLSFKTEGEGPAGTLVYMSPEQRAGKQPDARSDVFTFGVLLFEALTGTLPEPGDAPSDFVSRLPAAVDAIFKKCFARHERRYADVATLVKDLERALGSLRTNPDLRALVAGVPRRQEDLESIPSALAGRTTPAATEAQQELASPPAEPESEPEPAASPEPEPTASPELEPTASPEPEPTASPELEPTASPELEPTASPEPEPTASPEPEHALDAARMPLDEALARLRSPPEPEEERLPQIEPERA